VKRHRRPGNRSPVPFHRLTTDRLSIPRLLHIQISILTFSCRIKGLSLQIGPIRTSFSPRSGVSSGEPLCRP
jgi:hypothetical protein